MEQVFVTINPDMFETIGEKRAFTILLLINSLYIGVEYDTNKLR